MIQEKQSLTDLVFPEIKTRSIQEKRAGSIMVTIRHGIHKKKLIVTFNKEDL